VTKSLRELKAGAQSGFF